MLICRGFPGGSDNLVPQIIRPIRSSNSGDATTLSFESKDVIEIVFAMTFAFHRQKAANSRHDRLRTAAATMLRALRLDSAAASRSVPRNMVMTPYASALRV